MFGGGEREVYLNFFISQKISNFAKQKFKWV